MTTEERIIFNKLLDFLGIEFTLRYHGFSSKTTKCMPLEKTINFSTTTFSYTDAWNIDNEEKAVRFLLEECIEFIELQAKPPKDIISNPFLGCKSLEEAAIRLDLLNANESNQP